MIYVVIGPILLCVSMFVMANRSLPVERSHLPIYLMYQAAGRPFGIQWRSSYWFTTFVVGLGIAVDLLVYSLIIPVMPFYLERLQYTGVSAKTGWLLFAYSAGLVFSTIPIAMLSERYFTRKLPLIAGLFVLIGSQIMLMEAPNYTVMCVARVLQGVGSSMIWVVGLALLCDCCPPALVGRQLGIAMTGLSMGLMIGPPVGGALYSRFGYRGPFVFGLVATVVDLAGRLLVIERKSALFWGLDPTILPSQNAVDENENQDCNVLTHGSSDTKATDPHPESLSLWAVIKELSRSSRAVVALVITFIYGVVYSSSEPSMPLHLLRIWGLGAGKVGLVLIAGVLPTLLSSPLSGFYADRIGTAWVICFSIALALPWWVIVIIQRQLTLFVVAFAVESFFTSGVISPVSAELAAVSRGIEGVGYAHVYGAFNLAYGCGTSVGPVIGGQIYDHLNNGWTALCLLSTGLLTVGLVFAFCFSGDDPLGKKFMRRFTVTMSVT